MGPKPTPEEEMSDYPDDIKELIREGDRQIIDRYRYHTEEYSHREPCAHGGYIFYDKQGRIMTDLPISYAFGLSRASWLVIPRLALEEMPIDWQARFVALLDEAHDEHKMITPEGVYVSRKIKGRFVSNDHWSNYRRGSVREAVEVDLARGYIKPRDLPGYTVEE